MGGRALITKDLQTMQKDLDKIIQWFDKWQMFFNIYKCIVKHFGTRIKKHTYTMRNEQLRVKVQRLISLYTLRVVRGYKVPDVTATNNTKYTKWVSVSK